MSLFRASGGNKFKIANGTAKIRVAESKNLYFNAAIDSDWNTLGNWWLDSSFTVQATHLPRSIDSVLVDLGFAGSSLDANSGPIPTVYNLTVGDSQENLPRLSFSIDINILNVAIFSNNILVPSNINGNVIFNDRTYGNGGTINGNCVFNNSSVNYSNITGNATFNDSSLNSLGVIYGNATFNDNAANSAGSITVDAVFNDSAINGGVVYGNAIFNNNSINNGLVANIATFNDLACNNSSTGTAGTFIPDPPPYCPV